MISTLKSCSAQYINQIFEALNEFEDKVFWIRSFDMTKQYYIGSNFNDIWHLDLSIIHEVPALWTHYLEGENLLSYLKKFQERRAEYFLNQEKNSVPYIIRTPQNTIRYLVDRCFISHNTLGDHFVVGFSKLITSEQWHKDNISASKEVNANDIEAVDRFFMILENEFGITQLDKDQSNLLLLNQQNYTPENLQNFKFTQRELECLYQICQGKTNKEAAKALSISPRTVETHLEKIFNKTSCNSKLEIISLFTSYFPKNI